MGRGRFKRRRISRDNSKVRLGFRYTVGGGGQPEQGMLIQCAMDRVFEEGGRET